MSENKQFAPKKLIQEHDMYDICDIYQTDFFADLALHALRVEESVVHLKCEQLLL